MKPLKGILWIEQIYWTETVTKHWGEDSQALFSQGGGHILRQCGQLWRLKHVDASGWGHVAVTVGGGAARQPSRFNHNIRPVIHPCFCRVPEHQLMAFDLRKKGQDSNGHKERRFIQKWNSVMICWPLFQTLFFFCGEWGLRLFPEISPFVFRKWKKVIAFGIKRGWVNNYRSFMLGWTVPIRLTLWITGHLTYCIRVYFLWVYMLLFKRIPVSVLLRECGGHCRVNPPLHGPFL